MEKLVRDGKVGVVLSQGRHDAGWSTWNNEQFQASLAMDSRIVAAVLARNFGVAVDIAREIVGESLYENGADDLHVVWVPQGSAFSITADYTGRESLEFPNLTA